MKLEQRYTSQLGRSVLLRDNNSDDGMWEETFGRGLHVPPEMPDPKVVLDLGANIGLTAAHYQELWPDALVWMLEPHPDNMALARKNAPTCPPLQCAVARESGWKMLMTEDRTASAYELGKGQGITVRAVGMLELLSIVNPDFVKMDIEGEEWKILSLPFPMSFRLLVEFHGSGNILERGLELLADAGWEARHHSPHPYAVFATR